jgi:hypothetical protein
MEDGFGGENLRAASQTGKRRDFPGSRRQNTDFGAIPDFFEHSGVTYQKPDKCKRFRDVGAQF